MKILFLSDVPLKNPSSGSERVLHEQCAGLKRKGFQIYAITRNNGPSDIALRNINGVYEACYNAPVNNIIGFIFSLLKFPINLYKNFSDTQHFRIIISHQPFTYAALLLLANIKSIPKIYIFHSPAHEEFLLSNQGGNSFLNIFQVQVRKIIEGFCIKKSDKIIALSRYMKKKAESIHKIPEKHIAVNPGGVDLKNFKLALTQEKLKNKLNFPEGEIHLLTIRNLEPRMGLDNLLKAVLIVKKKFDIYLVIGGQGCQQKKLENMINKLNLNNRVIMPGYIRPELLADYYGASDFFILPTRKLEGFGLVTLESMACGTPVLGTPIGGTKEILSAFNTKLLFKDSSPNSIAAGIEKNIEHYFINKKKYVLLRQKCRKYVEEKYSWEQHISKLTEIIYKNAAL